MNLLTRLPFFLFLLGSVAFGVRAFAASAGVDLHDWRFDDGGGTQLSATHNAANPAVRWSGNFDNSTTTGTGVFRLRRNGANLNRRADVVSSPGLEERLRMTVEIAGWDLRFTSGTQPGIRFDFMNGFAADTPSEITAGFRLDRTSHGSVTLQAVANGTAAPGAEQSEAVAIFGSVQTDKLTFVVIYDGVQHRYEVRYRVGEGPWIDFFSGNTSGARRALSFRVLVGGDFDGGGANFLDWDRFTVSTDPQGVPPTISTGDGYFEYFFAARNLWVPVYTYLPVDAPSDPPIIIACHGNSRNARGNRNSWRTEADRRGALVIAPEFNDIDFPGTNFYNLGNRFSGATLNPQEVWTFQVVEDLFDEVVARMRSERQSYFLYGHSAGSQFVHRMLWFMPELRAEKAVMANAGWYTMPEIQVEYPHGFRNSQHSVPTVSARLAERHLVLLGTEDTDPNDPDLSQHPLAVAQGPHRFARGNRFYESVQRTANTLGVPLGWSLGFAPGVGHTNSEMIPFAANWLFSDWSARGSLLYNEAEAEFRERFTTGLPAATDNSAPWTDNITFPGLYAYFSETGTPATYRIGTSSAAGSIQHWREDDASTVGFLGGRASDAVGDIHYALRLTNNTAQTLYGITLRYDGMQFRNSNSGQVNRLHVAWRLGGGTHLLAGDWTAVPALAFEAPHAGDGVSGGVNLDPYQPANRRVIGPVSVTVPTWPPGEDLWIRWTDPNDPGVDHGIGFGNIRFVATAAIPPAPAEVGLPVLTRAGGGGARLSLPVGHHGQLYQLQASIDLILWQDIGETVPGNSLPLTWDLLLDGDRRFFRIVRTAQ